MNAASLYTQLSRRLFLLENDSNDDYLVEFMKGEKGLFKLRNFLLCRLCRKISAEPLSSKFCQHLICKVCIDQGLFSSSGCKWCRNKEDLTPDHQSTLLIGLFKQLCAILKDMITDSILRTGDNDLKQTFLKFVADGFQFTDVKVCVRTNIKVNEPTKSEPIPIKFIPPKKVNSSCQTEIIEIIETPSRSCCNCENKLKENQTNEDLSNDPIAVTAAESSTMKCDKQTLTEGVEPPSSDVSSTVPDNLPRKKSKVTNSYISSKIVKPSKKQCKEDSPKESEDLIPNINNHTDISASPYYDSISNLSLKSERKNRSIFEKFGLALSPPSPYLSSSESLRSDKEPKQKRKKSRESKAKNENEILKVAPLKLKMKKINSKNNEESTYLVQYDYEKVISDNVDKSCISTKPDVNGERKVKRKATFISDYTIFSDDSDFELSYQKHKKIKKTLTTPKIDRDICGCGSGGKVKYFTDICKRSRCPCFAQGKSCVSCKCRFCSNPYILEVEEEEEIFSESESESDQLFVDMSQRKEESELIDVEAM